MKRFLLLIIFFPLAVLAAEPVVDNGTATATVEVIGLDVALDAHEKEWTAALAAYYGVEPGGAVASGRVLKGGQCSKIKY